MKRYIKYLIIASIIVGTIVCIIVYKNYKERLESEKIAEEQRKERIRFEYQLETKRKDRYSKYLLVESLDDFIGSQFFEKDLTSIEYNKRKTSLINWLPGNVFNLYVKLKDIQIISGNRVVTFYTGNVNNSTYWGYNMPSMRNVFYDNDKLFSSLKTGTLHDIEIKAIKISSIRDDYGNEILNLYFNIISVNDADDGLDEREISGRNW